MSPVNQRISSILAGVVGAVLIAAVGWYFLGAAGRFFSHLSYDLPFAARNNHPTDICIIYMTDDAGRWLNQGSGVWKRTLHAELTRRISADGPRAIFFDLVFGAPSTDPAEDPDFADAIQKAGCVYLAAEMEVKGENDRSGIASEAGARETIIPPLPMYRKVAAGWGIVAFRPKDEDFGVRRIYMGTDLVPSLTWKMAVKLGALLPEDESARLQTRWINYYGKVDGFAHYPYNVALDRQALPPGYFKDKVVFIGGRSGIGVLGLGKDEFRHPLSRLTNDYIPGPELQATIFSNLYRGEWLNRLSEPVETGIILAFGVLLAAVLPRFTPVLATLAALGITVVFVLAVLWVVFTQRVWFAWGVPVFVQVPLGLGWAIGSRYFLVERRRDAFRKAFAAYLSPHLAARVDEAALSLAPGGTIVETSIIFTDLEGFTTLSEELNDPTALASLLTHYFTRTSAHVLENDGTIIKYIGDAVFAVWGAPLRDSRHATKAARAACRMHREAQREIDGRLLRTRIGVHTGRVLAGNLGSLQRFDYTCIGDPVNFAARLEGLNKHLGTSILISDETFQRLNGDFVTRPLGQFRVVGKKQPVTIHQLLGEKESMSTPAYVETFACALGAYQKRNLDLAERMFRRVIEEKGGSEPDGPSAFYIKQIALDRATGTDPEWDGVVDITSK
jgi:adenylate cyclase